MPWSNHEITQTLHSYFQMLALEINQTPYSKAVYRRALQQRLNDRSESAIEFKHQNISAILIKYGRPYILGYKPRTHYQQSLEPAVLEYLATNKQLEQDFDLFASSDQLTLPDHVNFQNWLQDRPNPATSVAEPSTEYKVRINKTNYLEIEQTNRRLGLLGEELVISYERWRLLQKGKDALADKIEWVSHDQGDGAGFDILSKNTNGTDRYIEVKTTKLGKQTPIYLTRNELLFSQRHVDHFHLYRVFEFGKTPKLFRATGSLDAICLLEPVNFIGRF